MKNLYILVLALFVMIGLTSCGKDIVEKPAVDEREETHYEIVKKFMEDFSIPNQDSIVKNIMLPKKIADEGIITWKSSDSKVITSEGYVTRSNTSDMKITLTALCSYGSTSERRVYEVTVKKFQQDIEAQVNEAISDFYLLEDNTVDRNVMILPRTTDINAVYINWATANNQIIDLDGNVYRQDNVQNVKLTATFSKESITKTKEFDVKVETTKDDSPAVITESDSRIKNKKYVNNTTELLGACIDLQPGDAIILNDGNYVDIPLTINASGNEENPIFIFAKNPGKAFITGESSIDVYGDYVTISSLFFKDGYPKFDKGVVVLVGNHLRFTNNQIQNYELKGNDFKWLSLTGRFHEIDRNTFDGKSTGGSLLTVWRDDMSGQNHHIYKNQFMNFSDAGGANGYETIRIGTSTYSQSDSNVLVEDNYFKSVNGEIEIISIKAGRTIVRNNTFEDCVGLVTARHGKNDLIAGNIFKCNNISDTGGIRMYDSGHIIRNNYIEKANSSSNTRAGIVIHSGVNEVGTTTVMNLQWVPFNVLLENNTIVDSRQSILIGGKYSVAATDITFKNNLIVSPTYAAMRFDKLITNAVFENNHFYSPIFGDESGLIKNVQPFEGIDFSTEILSLEANDEGLKLHSNYGAAGLRVSNIANTGINWK